MTTARTPAEIRAAILDPSRYTGPREPGEPLAVTQRQFGGEFIHWDATVDLEALLRPLAQRDGISRDLQHVLRTAWEEPNAENATRAERALRDAANAAGREDALANRLHQTAQSLPYHAAAFGSSDAAAWCSARSLDLAWTLLSSGHDIGGGWLALRAALLWASDAQEDLTDVKYKPRPLFDRLTAFDLKALGLARAFAAIAKAEEMIRDEDEILRGGAGAAAGGSASADDLPGLEEDLPTLGALIDAGRPKAPARPAAAGLVVIPSLAHLPEASKLARDRGDSPRALGEPWAGKRMPLTPAPDPRAFSEALLARFPWAVEAIEAYAQDLVGAPYARFTPRLLVGPAGCGKTAFARAVVETAGLDVTVYSAAGQMDGGSFSGTSRQWSTWRPSVPAQACLRHGKASHGVIVDEVEKAGDARRWGRLDETLLPFLERGSTARSIHDPAFETALDLSAVSYVLTANAIDGLAGPLRDRCAVIHWPAPRAQDLAIVAAAILDDLRRDRGLDETWCPPLDGDELDALSAWRGGSLRPLRRMVEAVVASRETFARRLPN